MKIRTVKTNNFIGDTFRRVEIEINNQWYPVIGISKNDYGLWESDTNGREFKTITEAKNYVKENYKQFI